MVATHSPGPWSFDGSMIRDAEGNWLVQFEPHIYVEEGRKNANAQLMSLAYLLPAILRYLKNITRGHDEDDCSVEASEAFDLIAKLEDGESA